MLLAQHILGTSYIGGALLAKRLPVPLVARGTVLFPQAFVLSFDRRKQRNAVCKLLYSAAINGVRSERYRLFEPQHGFGRGRRRLADAGAGVAAGGIVQAFVGHSQVRQWTLPSPPNNLCCMITPLVKHDAPNSRCELARPQRLDDLLGCLRQLDARLRPKFAPYIAVKSLNLE